MISSFCIFTVFNFVTLVSWCWGFQSWFGYFLKHIFLNLFPCVAGTIIIFFLFSCLIFRFCIMILFYGLLFVRLDLVLSLKHVNWKTMLFSAVQCLETKTFDQYQASGSDYFECKLFSFLFFICWFSLSTGFAPLWFTINTYFFLWMLQNYHTWLFEIFLFLFLCFGTAWSSLLCWSATWFK
jgi:hypothetical protein